jgi:hypothetical protein
LRVDGVPADTSALFMARQIVAIHGVTDGSKTIDQLRRNLGRQEILDVHKGTLPHVIGAQTLHVERI